jgi:KipI family sensor histidine kinase inhibitor
VNVERLGDEALRWPRPRDVEPRALLAALRAHPGVRDVVITEDHVAIVFDPSAPPDRPWEVRPRAIALAPPREHVVRVRYDGEDLAEVARALGADTEEVVRLHTAPTYEVAMLGFLPGFAYLRGADARLAIPRRESPRPRVPAGAVAIAAGYTGIYPVASAGGWHLVGHAVGFAPWSPERGAIWSLGDRVRFERSP